MDIFTKNVWTSLPYLCIYVCMYTYVYMYVYLWGKDKQKIYIYFGVEENLLYSLCLHTKYSIWSYFKYRNKNKVIIIENMLSMQAEKSSSGQKFSQNTCWESK